ncbi:MAG: plasmid segregation protein ParM [Bacillota bacterium]|nr:plasmid segregation protein ParM [Bacillota bacterium]
MSFFKTEAPEPLVAKHLVAVDVGYGYVKAVSAAGRRVCFPSIAAPRSGDLGINDLLGGRGPGHAVSVRYEDGCKGEYLVGEAARGSYLASAFLGAEKPADLHDLLLLTACALLTGGDDCVVHADLAVGLPLAFYKAQRAALAARLENLAAWVGVDDENERKICFTRVLVIPQGVGVVFSQRLPHGRGYAGVIDVGQYTTDYLLVDLSTMTPVVDACGSVEAGCHLVAQRINQAYLVKTGRPLPPRLEQWALEALKDGCALPYRGGELDLSEEFDAAVRDAAATITRQVLSAWRDIVDMIAVTYLAGGGALLFGEHLSALPRPVPVKEPVFANALGYLRMLEQTA